MKVYQTNKEHIEGIITIHQKTRETFGYDVQMMLEKKFTFEEAIASPEFHIIPRQRLKMVQNELWEQLDAVLG